MRRCVEDGRDLAGENRPPSCVLGTATGYSPGPGVRGASRLTT